MRHRGLSLLLRGNLLRFCVPIFLLHDRQVLLDGDSGRDCLREHRLYDLCQQLRADAGSEPTVYHEAEAPSTQGAATTVTVANKHTESAVGQFSPNVRDAKTSMPHGPNYCASSWSQVHRFDGHRTGTNIWSVTGAPMYDLEAGCVDMVCGHRRG